MNYTYDILANFNKNYYDFYDWNSIDEITHIKKLPILKVDRFFLNTIKNNDVTVEKEILEKIYKKAELFKNKQKENNYICALCDGTKAIIVKFDSYGKVIGKSSLLIDEENEIIDLSENIEVNNYKIKQTKTKKQDSFKTRKEIEITKYIIEQLNKIEAEKLKYLYYDCFNIKEEDTKKILENIKKQIKNNFETTYIKIYDFLKLASNRL